MHCSQAASPRKWKSIRQTFWFASHLPIASRRVYTARPRPSMFVIPAQAGTQFEGEPTMKLRISENFRAVFYAPFYAIRALGLPEREGLTVEWLNSEAPGSSIEQVKRGAIDAQWGGPMRVLKDHDSMPADGASLLSFGEVVWRDPFYLIGRQRSFQLKDAATLRLGIVSEVPTPWYCLRADLEDAGVDLAAMKSAGRLVDNLSMAQQLEALAAGKLDAAQLYEPYASDALAD